MTLPIALMGTDLIGQARTGTGKTLGFGIPLLQRTISPGEADYEELAAPGKPQALVVTPTRELTIQVAKDLETASTVRTVRILTIYGGVAYDPQLDQLKAGVDVVVGTPGRLLDLANRGVLDLSHIKVLVLDEADEMLDLGFLPDVERILRKTPELRQTMLFSATMPSAVISLARTHMRHPLNIRAESHDDTQMVPTTAQFVYRAHDLDKPEVVARILQAEDRGRVMIFCRTKREASRLTDDLIDRGFKAAAIHGDLNQQARERALTGSAATRSTSWSVPTSPPAVSMSRASRTSSTTPAPRTRRPTSTGSAAPARRRERYRGHLRRLGGRRPLEDDQQGARPAVRRAAGDLLHLAGAVPRPRHPDRGEGPDQAGPRGGASGGRDSEPRRSDRDRDHGGIRERSTTPRRRPRVLATVRRGSGRTATVVGSAPVSRSRVSRSPRLM